MNEAQTLPTYSDEHLARLSPSELVDLLIGDEDRVPRNEIDECARRGDAMAECLSTLLADDGCWQDDAPPGKWWLLLHAVMILGLISSERAGLLLVEFMYRMAREDDGNLQDWLAGYWPALFRNKPAGVDAALRALCEDRALDWYIRASAVDAFVDAARLRGSEPLDNALAWVAGVASDEQEDWDMRLSISNVLLDFPRVQYRPLLDKLAARQSEWDMQFSEDDIRDAYLAAEDKAAWDHRGDPWSFYAQETIESRQRRWEKEYADDENEVNDDEEWLEGMALPYMREAPKVGRNDPCPCGSGKKYKKCCLAEDEARSAPS